MKFKDQEKSLKIKPNPSVSFQRAVLELPVILWTSHAISFFWVGFHFPGPFLLPMSSGHLEGTVSHSSPRDYEMLPGPITDQQTQGLNH